MFRISVTITGPGGCISQEYRVIHDALVKAGASVTIRTPMRPLPFCNITARSLEGTHILLTVDEQPWGG